VYVDVAIVSAGLAVEAAAVGSYIRTLVRGESEPHWVSWLVWTLIGAIGSWAAFDGEAGVIGVLVPLSFVAVTFAVFALTCARSSLLLDDHGYASAAYPAYLLVANLAIAAVVTLARP
jgi:hypothetical protein